MLVVILLFGAFIGLVPALIAADKGRSFLGWWLFGWALFIVALPCALMAKPSAAIQERRALASGTTRKCPSCAEIVRAEAKVCRFCGRNLPPV